MQRQRLKQQQKRHLERKDNKRIGHTTYNSKHHKTRNVSNRENFMCSGLATHISQMVAVDMRLCIFFTFPKRKGIGYTKTKIFENLEVGFLDGKGILTFI